MPALRTRRAGSRLGHSRGQSLVEFAIVFPVLFLVLAAIIQFGLIFWAQNTLTQVVRDTGRWEATQQGQCNNGASALVAQADKIAQASSLLGYTPGLWNTTNLNQTPAPREGLEVDWPNPDPSLYTNADCPPDTNQIVWFVNIRAQHVVPLFFPVIGNFIPSCTASDCSLSASVQFRMEPAQ